MIKLDDNSRIPNTTDELHCTQVALIMAVQILQGKEISLAEAEVASGFRPGKETWPYAMLAWLAAHGYDVVHIDALDALSLADDPRCELKRSGLDEDTIDYFFQISDFQTEAANIRRCIAVGVQFQTRRPTIADCQDALQEGWLPILSLDASTLLGAEYAEFNGHVVLVTGLATSESVILQDPGPPPHWDWQVSSDVVQAALRSPSESSGTATLIRLHSEATGGDHMELHEELAADKNPQDNGGGQPAG